MGRGIAGVSPLTKKCSCNNPNWCGDRIEVNSNTKEVSYILECINCRANWKTKKREARKYWNNETLFDKLDSDRGEYLRAVVQKRKDELKAAQAALDKAVKELSKHENGEK